MGAGAADSGGGDIPLAGPVPAGTAELAPVGIPKEGLDTEEIPDGGDGGAAEAPVRLAETLF